MTQQRMLSRPPVQFGSFRRVTPISRSWGSDRGQPVDRRYIENFLKRHADDKRGRVLEFHNNSYTRLFGGNRVTKSECLTLKKATRSQLSSVTWLPPTTCPRTPSTALL